MKKVPELKNEKLEDAKEILDKAGIFYEEDEEKEFSLRVRRGRITRTEPKENEEIKDGEKVTLYVSKLWLLPFILIFILFFLVLVVGGIGVSQLINNNRPIIESTYEGWVPRNTVYVKKDVNVSELDTYLYCVTKNKSSKKCDWKETKTKSTYLSESGKWNVFFKARYKDGKYSYVSNRKEVLIDNNAPIVESITKNVSSNSLSFNIKAVDHESGIKTISYKIGNKDYEKVNNKFTISKLEPDTEYTITVRIEDNAGNVYEVTYKEKTNNKDDNTTTPEGTTNKPDNTTNNSSSNNTTNNNGTTNSVDNTTNSSGNVTNPSDNTKPTESTDKTNPTNPSEKPTEKPTDKTTEKTEATKPTDKTEPTDKTKPTESTSTTEKTKPTESTKTTEKTKPTESTKTTEKTKPVEPVVEIPKIDLNDLPSSFEYGDDYKLPSHVEFGESGGTYSCALDHDWSKNVESTKDFAVGEYTVSCKAVSNTGAYAEVSKDIKVTVPTGEDEEWDGWIRLNLYYPAESTNREWRIHREGEIRGEEDDWQAYTGPILVKVSDIENVYIRYDVNGEKKIDVPTGKVLVDIQASKLSLKGSETTKVKIVFDNNADTKEYRINGGKWTEYTKEFSVAADTLIEARATKKENVYDAEGNIIMEKTLSGSDALYIGEAEEEKLDFGTVNIEIKAEKNPLADNERTNVQIEYEENSTSRMYKIDNGQWLEYTGGFTVTANQTVYAKATKQVSKTLDDGTVRKGIAKGNTHKTILSESNPIEENNLGVYIHANPTRVLKNNQATITITCNEANSRIYYSLDNSNYIEYTEEFKVGANQTIYAYAEYEGKRAYDYEYIEAITIPDILEGPFVIVNPTSVSEATTVTIGTKEEAKNIYYSFDGGAYQVYTEPFTVNKNGIVRTYYIRSDGKKSETTYYYVQNIKEKNKPYVRIDANPSIYLSEDVDRVIVTISGSNYDTLEYSFDGIVYQPYTTPLEITRSRSVYARGTNEYGSTIEKLNITTSIAPTPIEELDVAITLDPEEKDVTGLIDKLEVTINYDKRAKGKYYRLGSGELLPYTGPFEVTENTTVYAYATSEGGLGSTSKQINYLTTGIASPIINVNPTTPNSWVRVEIEYASTASVKKYKIDNGEWLDYTSPIELITNNTKVYAYNEDTLGHHEETEYLIDNIIPKENIQVLDNGMYYLIRLNYPTSSNPSDREYKWKKDGVWKKYDEKGILLIRPEYKDKVIGADGVKIKDSNGKEIILKDHYYVLDVPLSEMAENLFMRWDLAKPSTPTFTLSTEDWARKVTVAINYDKVSVEKLYKVVYEDGEDTGWLEYTEPVEIDKNNAIIYAKSINDVEIQSEIGSKKITNIDDKEPAITDVDVIKKGSSNFTVEVTAEDDLSKVDTYMYSLNNKDFETSKNNTYTFTKLRKETEYKVYVKVIDKAGNESEVYEITVVTDDIGEISYLLDKEEWATEKVLTINYPSDVYDGYAYEYSLDLGVSWLTYENPLEIKENDTTVIARVVDGENIKVAASFTVLKIDATIPTINLDGLPSKFSKDKEYNLPSSYTDGISGSVRICKVPDRDTNYTKSSELPVGKYTLTCTITTGAGLTAEVSKDIEVTNATIKGDSILSILESDKLKTGYYNFEINGTGDIYPVHLYVLDGDQNWTEDKVFGDAGDVGTKNDYAQNMVIVKVNGDVTIAEGITVRPFYNNYGGPKGFTLYVTGKLTNNGTIDNSHGAKAEGQNVYLWKNADGTYEYVPAEGAAGGTEGGTGRGSTAKVDGSNGTNRSTGGGGSGTGKATNNRGGLGSAGTSYSGGTGGGGAFYTTGGNGSPNGGMGGTAGSAGISGTGNPAGTSGGTVGNNGTGGLLIICSNEYENNGKITAQGKASNNSPSTEVAGGASGGGSINIFTNQTTGIEQLGVITNTKYNEIKGNTNTLGGAKIGTYNYAGAGGTGAVSIGEIREGQYYDLKEIIEQDKEAYKNSVTRNGDSILSILSDSTLKSGYWYFKVNGEEYPVHLYVLDGNQNWTANKVFGDANDVGTSSTYAQNMVIVKVNGNVTIASGVTVSPYYDTNYGGPKGFTLYVTGKLTNNGIIDNSHGAKAEGQNVYLWKNTNGTYEYVPATGGAGGASAANRGAGTRGTNGSGRQTGGGGSGGNWDYPSGAGTAGTSYSGGTGGGGGYSGYKVTESSKTGGTGGNGYGGGAGNPGGSGNKPGTTGTGGLIVLYAYEFVNNGTLTAKGQKGGNAITGGGSSGGGSINAFASTTITNNGTVSAAGGASVGTSYKSGAGGSGTITYTQIDMLPVSAVVNTIDTASRTLPNPIIMVDSVDEAPTKTITIKYTSGYTNEYSLDLGESWTPYETPITVSDNLTVIARIKSGNKVLASSTFTITKIKKLDIPKEFIEGDDYTIPDSCTINEIRYNNINELVSGEYNLVCKLTNGDIPLVNKNITIRKKLEE